MPVDYGGEGGNGSSGTIVTPESCLGPCLDEVCQWICNETDLTQGLDIGNIGVTTGGLYAGDSDDDEDVATYGDESGESASGAGGVFGLLQDIG